jgi:hypothetical protein
VRALVRVRCDHDQPHRPFAGRPPMKRISGGQLSLGAVATLLSGHPEGPRAAASDTTFPGQTGRRQRRLGSARRPENQSRRSDVTATTRATLTARGVCSRPAGSWSSSEPGVLNARRPRLLLQAKAAARGAEGLVLLTSADHHQPAASPMPTAPRATAGCASRHAVRESSHPGHLRSTKTTVRPVQASG